jgi:hypothetical protein
MHHQDHKLYRKHDNEFTTIPYRAMAIATIRTTAIRRTKTKDCNATIEVHLRMSQQNAMKISTHNHKRIRRENSDSMRARNWKMQTATAITRLRATQNNGQDFQ